MVQPGQLICLIGYQLTEDALIWDAVGANVGQGNPKERMSSRDCFQKRFSLRQSVGCQRSLQ